MCTKIIYQKLVVNGLVYGEVAIHELMYRSEIVNNELMIAYSIKISILAMVIDAMQGQGRIRE